MRKVRNLKVRLMPSGSLFPEEVTQYDPAVLREALHNCIAHQDYEERARITVTEDDNGLTFSNRGTFIPGSIENVLATNAPPEVYRNGFLVQAMVNLNMIDTIGSGILRMFRVQKARSFPLPDYDLSAPGRVSVRVEGRVIDENYTKLLLRGLTLNSATSSLWTESRRGNPLMPRFSRN